MSNTVKQSNPLVNTAPSPAVSLNELAAQVTAIGNAIAAMQTPVTAPITSAPIAAMPIVTPKVTTRRGRNKAATSPIVEHTLSAQLAASPIASGDGANVRMVHIANADVYQWDQPTLTNDVITHNGKRLLYIAPQAASGVKAGSAEDAAFRSDIRNYTEVSGNPREKQFVLLGLNHGDMRLSASSHRKGPGKESYLYGPGVMEVRLPDGSWLTLTHHAAKVPKAK